MGDHTHNPPPVDPLTERELDVLRLMSDGLSNRDIAEQLVISFETVRWYNKQIYSKLGVHSRAQAIIHAREMKLFEEDTDLKPSTPEAETLPAGKVSEITVSNNLPHYPLSFVGRTEEFGELLDLLAKPEVRLITVAGPGGIGKTRLCVEAAQQALTDFPDGVIFVPLNTVIQAADIPSAMMQGLNIRLTDNIEERLFNYLNDKYVLFILDNFEHLVDNSEFIRRMLENTGNVKLLVTSRASLNLREEWVRYIEGIPLPADDAIDMESNDAVRLFVDRAERVRGDFDLQAESKHVIEICRLVDGMPLAIELATTWLKTLKCEDIAREIRSSIDFLTTRERDVDERHRSIRAVFDYSWKLLAEDERRVFRRLSVFRGGFGYSAARQIAGATPQLLADLIDKSLLYQNAEGVYIIHDLLRKYAEQRLIITDAQHLSTRSAMIGAWSSLVKGRFDKVYDVLDDLLSDDNDQRTAFEEAFGLALMGVMAGLEGDYARGQQLCEASANLSPLEEDQRDPITTVLMMLGLSIASCGQKDYYAAKRNILTALNIAMTLQAPAFTTLCLPVIAIVLAHEVEVERAVQLIALAFTHPASTPTWLEQWPLLQRLLSDLRIELDTNVFRQAWENGKSLDLKTTCETLQVRLSHSSQS